MKRIFFKKQNKICQTIASLIKDQNDNDNHFNLSLIYNSPAIIDGKVNKLKKLGDRTPNNDTFFKCVAYYVWYDFALICNPNEIKKAFDYLIDNGYVFLNKDNKYDTIRGSKYLEHKEFYHIITTSDIIAIFAFICSVIALIK